jgi:hypothetical protein
MTDRIMTGIALLLGFAMLVNAAWQLSAPEAWYWAIPGVPDRGAFNQHFVRDIGIVYALAGVGLVIGAMQPLQRFAYWWAPTLWLTGHALFHVWEVLAGICGPASLVQDFAGVTLPALIALTLLWYARRDPVRVR